MNMKKVAFEPEAIILIPNRDFIKLQQPSMEGIGVFDFQGAVV